MTPTVLEIGGDHVNSINRTQSWQVPLLALEAGIVGKEELHRKECSSSLHNNFNNDKVRYEP